MPQNNSRGKSKKKKTSWKGRNSNSKARTWKSDVVADDLKDGSFNSSQNDWRWYATNPQLVKDSASYPFGYALGAKVQYGPYGANASERALPGLCTLYFTPTVGYSNHTNSPINIASRKIFTDMRKANAGATNYDPVDMMVYLTAMDSAYFLLEHYKRAYGLARSVSPVNRYYPRAVIEAMGFDYDDLIANLDDFRALINTYAQKLKCLVVPNGMSYMAKHQWMCSGIYQDRPSDKAQLYMFVPRAYYTFEYDTAGAGMLRGRSWNSYTYAQAKAVLDSVIDPILANQDFAIMSGDLLKWRGEGGVVIPTGITETYQIFSVYDESVLDQIQNATIVGEPVFYTSSNPFDITGNNADDYLCVCQDTNKEYLVGYPSFTHPWAFSSGVNPNPGRNAYMSRRFVNFTHGDVKPEEVMEATRLTNIGVYERTTTQGKDVFKFPTMGSEVISSVDISYYHLNSQGEWKLTTWPIRSFSDVFVLSVKSTGMNAGDLTYTMSEMEDFIIEINMMANFNRHPYLALSAGVQDDANVLASQYAPWAGYFGDVDYYAVVDDQDLAQMAEVALLSEFNVRLET